ncbi:MAG: penicillin-binding protein 2 [Candidatus Aminicenantes bacterium]|nr:penicillin-binding protein 2 [Candidatus Aminicenantes bacterium]
MEKNRIYEDLSPVLVRTKRTSLVVGGFFLFLLFFIWKIQVLDYKKYWALSESNRIRESVLTAPRGLVVDRNGIILADNAASFKASLIRENCQDYDLSLRRVSQLLDIEEDVLRKRIAKYESLPRFMPIVVKDSLDLREASKIEARKLEFPELIVETDPRRFYPFGSLAAHVIGYLQELSPEEIKAGRYKGKNLGDLVGRTGIEQEYESLLVGVDGRLTQIVDSLGRPREEVGRLEPVPGQTIELNLDFDLQQKATALLEGREGAIVVLDPRKGEILALGSFPTYDPNKFITRFTPEEWMALVNRPDHPLENRAIRGLYAPGSIFKLVMALAGLDSGVIAEQTTFFCAGTVHLYGRPFSCWFSGGHGVINLTEAIRQSCNIYFYQTGRRMGIERIAEYAAELGLGSVTGVDLAGEKSGLIPSPGWSQQVRKSPWFAGETISVAIGQGPLLVTPLQVAVFTGLVANRGERVTPRLLRSAAHAPVPKESEQSRVRPGLQSKTFEAVIKGMWKGVNEEGTGRGASVGGFDVCGKTGSTQTISRERAEKLKREVKTHSWFSGFAPRDNPKVVVTVLVEYGGLGGATAAPLARELFELYRKKYD